MKAQEFANQLPVIIDDLQRRVKALETGAPVGAIPSTQHADISPAMVNLGEVHQRAASITARAAALQASGSSDVGNVLGIIGEVAELIQLLMPGIAVLLQSHPVAPVAPAPGQS